MKRIVLCGVTAIVSSMLCAQDFPSDQIAGEIQEELPVLTSADDQESKVVDWSATELVVVNQPLVDDWYGFGACYQLWQDIKKWSGSGSNQTLYKCCCEEDGTLNQWSDLVSKYWQDVKNWGSFSESNQVIGEEVLASDDSDRKEVLLAESTEGAIRILDDLIVQYKAASTSAEYSEEERAMADLYVEDLQQDHKRLLENQNEQSLVSQECLEEEQIQTALYTENPVLVDENS